MFYEGSLQEGISSAVGQQKLVFCFVTNDNDESRQWQDEHLQDSTLKELIQKQAVALRLEAGSEEAGYLAQIFPLPQTPTIVIMKHGELKEYIAAGTSRDDFFRRVQNAFNATPAPAPAAASSTAESSSSPAAHPSAAASSSSSAPAPAAAGISSSPENERSETVRRVLADRAAKLQAAKEEAERRAKEERAQAKEKARADAEAGADTDAARTHRQAELLRKKRQQETEERRRILKRIEDDKAERRERAAERQQMRLDTQRTAPSTTRIGEMTSLQVRLFDGSTIRSRFKTRVPFRDVRRWVDENRTDGKLPYTFRQLLTPRPNRAIDATEEGKSLGELGLAPSSTLILIPVQHFASAYDAAPQNIFARIFTAIMGLVMWLLGLIGLGGRGEAAPRPAAAPETEGTSSAAQLEKDRRIRGFQNPNDQRRDHQLYNGNSLNFEPRPDEEDSEAR
ncbi:hypothetical protein ACCO45_010525 [Purpureocillium lilacinum]|uniref:Uncharacterized protein n=1 Tax=Purpureocillium lilacinum TaxID=33203 RepID=A0ACC4DGM4_PURLI